MHGSESASAGYNETRMKHGVFGDTDILEYNTAHF